jgi:hypothetical protein
MLLDTCIIENMNNITCFEIREGGKTLLIKCMISEIKIVVFLFFYFCFVFFFIKMKLFFSLAK